MVRLRAMEPEDLDVLYTIENDVSLWGVGTTNVPYSRYTLHEYIAHASSDIYTDRQVRLMIENEDAEIIGIVDLVRYEPQHHRAELGIVIKNAFRRKGYAAAAIGEMLRYAREIWHLHQLYVIVDEQNVAAKNLFEKLSFEPSVLLKHWLFDGKKYHDAVLIQRFL